MSRDRDVRLAVTYREREPGDGGLADSHHWHAEAWVGDEKVENSWCFSRTIALDECLGALAVAGVEWPE